MKKITFHFRLEINKFYFEFSRFPYHTGSSKYLITILASNPFNKYLQKVWGK